MCACRTDGDQITKCDRPSHYRHVPPGYQLVRWLTAGQGLQRRTIGAVLTRTTPTPKEQMQ